MAMSEADEAALRNAGLMGLAAREAGGTEIVDSVSGKAIRVIKPDGGDLTPAEELAAWWRLVAEGEIEATVEKAVEYGATDLLDLGHDLARTAGRTVSDEEAAELGVYFYLRGKVSRWTAAILEGRRVSDDTLLDIGIYVRMAQRIRQKGGWPS